MRDKLRDKDWDTLLKRIEAGNCTPFLGAGACAGVLPLAGEIAEKWAEENDYPLTDCRDLARVAQFLAVDRGDPVYPKEEIAKLFKKKGAVPDFNDPSEPHALLADLPLPIYITTNYDDFMMQALNSRNRNAVLELCRWNRYIQDLPSVFESESGFIPSKENPLVFHLHGQMEVPQSLVLGEDDYLDFLVNISRDQQALIPPVVFKALAYNSLLFIGYRLADWNFRVIFRGLVSSVEGSLQTLNIAVQLPPEDSEYEQNKAQNYLTEYFRNIKVLVYWGTASEFVKELRERWKKFKGEEKGQ
jgi:hypothetical protein